VRKRSAFIFVQTLPKQWDGPHAQLLLPDALHQIPGNALRDLSQSGNFCFCTIRGDFIDYQ
jgi:hypothetical protein